MYSFFSVDAVLKFFSLLLFSVYLCIWTKFYLYYFLLVLIFCLCLFFFSSINSSIRMMNMWKRVGRDYYERFDKLIYFFSADENLFDESTRWNKNENLFFFMKIHYSWFNLIDDIIDTNICLSKIISDETFSLCKSR